jgi:hypothetical protein
MLLERARDWDAARYLGAPDKGGAGWLNIGCCIAGLLFNTAEVGMPNTIKRAGYCEAEIARNAEHN